jgi:NADPH:quinone reductase-like Zn-dependent oxidoreductase
VEAWPSVAAKWGSMLGPMVDETRIHERWLVVRDAGREPFVIGLQAGADLPWNLRRGRRQGYGSLVRTRSSNQGALANPFVRQRMRVFVVRHNRDDLAVLKDLVEAGKVTLVIDRRYALREVPEAARYHGEGHSQGKFVITV